jgi:hypothetical protein
MPVESGHLSDDQLLDEYFLCTDTSHVSVCPSCRHRFDELARALDHARQDGINEADAVFTHDRLHDQRDRIVRRLERQGQTAEVLRFPNRFGAERASHRLLGPVRRWVAGAAAAGLVAGVILGFAVDRRVSAPLTASAGVMAMPANLQHASAQDEQILSEIEDSLSGPSRRVVELRAIDDMTMPTDLQEASFIPR